MRGRGGRDGEGGGVTTRGIRNNNPGNLRRGKDAWQGLADIQPDPDFLTFTDPVFGIRALAVLLEHYREKHGLDTVRSIINRYAPPSENATGNYIWQVSRALGVGPDDRVDVRDPGTMIGLVEAIIEREQGSMPYPIAVIDEGLRLAGVAIS